MNESQKQLIREIADKYAYTRPQSGEEAIQKRDSLIEDITNLFDLAIKQTEERIVGEMEEIDISCVDDRLLGKTDEYLEGYNTSTRRWREKRDEIITLIRNK